MTELKTIEGRVMSILQKQKETRDSDRELLVEYIKRYCPELQNKPITEAIQSPEFPNTESLRRSRQKLQATFDELRPTEPTKRRRSKLQEDFTEYARS